MTANTDALFTSARTGDAAKDEWQTPLWLYLLLDNEFKFNLDAAATPKNALCQDYFCDHRKYPTALGDGLISSWWGNVFVNPPYSQLKKWVEKSYIEVQKGNANNVVMLVAARTDTQAWWKYIRFGEVRFLPGRIKYGASPEYVAKAREENERRKAEGNKKLLPEDGFTATFPSAVVIFHGGGYLYPPQTIYWNVRDPK